MKVDPSFFRARREAVIILVAFVAFMAWTVGYCALFGYGTASGPQALVLGMPSWTVWGVVAPWVAATLFSVWFGLRYIVDDDA